MPSVHPIDLTLQPDRIVTAMLINPAEEDHSALRRIFARTKWELFSSYSCEEACRVLHTRRISVLVTEKDLPDGDWRSMLAASARYPAAPKVVVTYRFSEVHLLRDIIEGGAYDILAKPFRDVEVTRVISFGWQQWLRERRAADSRKIPRAVGTPHAGRAIA
ncbi:MAG: hypothetical protein IPM24_03090 [Bryobacterales bacterium]|nr:hypothetical protein [Bryobacterales bacterium]